MGIVVARRLIQSFFVPPPAGHGRRAGGLLCAKNGRAQGDERQLAPSSLYVDEIRRWGQCGSLNDHNPEGNRNHQVQNDKDYRQ